MMVSKCPFFFKLMAALLLFCALSTLFLTSSSSLQAQLNPTEQQQTVDALIQQFFNETATAAAVVNPATQTAVFQQTVMASFQQAQTATARAVVSTPTLLPTVMPTVVLNPELRVEPRLAIRGRSVNVSGTGFSPVAGYTLVLRYSKTNRIIYSTSIRTDAAGDFSKSFTPETDDPSGGYRVEIRQSDTLMADASLYMSEGGNTTATRTPQPQPQPGAILRDGLAALSRQGSSFDFTGWKQDAKVGYQQVEVTDSYNYIQWTYVSDKVYRAFILAGEVQFDNGPMDGACGFVFYDNNRNDTHYSVWLNRNLIFDWQLQRNGTWLASNFVFTPENTGVRGGARESNQWVILSENGQMVILVNGGMIGYLPSAELISGKVAMAAYTPTNYADNSCVFRTVEVWVPG